MASESEASCEADPNFAVICGFLEKFGTLCGLNSIDFLDLQEMLENTQEVSQDLIDLHVKLLRKARKSVSTERWERALIKLCHTFCSKDGWELERFGYKKARISSKLRILKQLLEMQFDFNQKFKNDVNKMSAEELRSQPIGRDTSGRVYWYQCDETCQIRVYKDDPDEETWSLIVKDREGLVSLISQLSNGESAKSSSEPVSNEDSNSVEVEKPILDTGQKSEETETSDSDKVAGDIVEAIVNKDVVESDNAQSDTIDVDKDVKIPDETNNEELATDNGGDVSIDDDEEVSEGSQNDEGLDLTVKPKDKPLEQPRKEFIGIKGKYIRGESCNNILTGKAVRSASRDALSYKRPLEDVEIEVPQNVKRPRLNRPTLLMKKAQDPNENEDGATDEEDEECGKEGEEDEVGEEIEEPLMLVQGEGEGRQNKSENKAYRSCKETCPIIGEEIVDTFYFSGEGSGEECGTGNESAGRSEDKGDKLKINENNTPAKETKQKMEDAIDSTSSENIFGTPKSLANRFGSNTDHQQPSSSFFFGSKTFGFTQGTKAASLSFGATLSGEKEIPSSSSSLEQTTSNIQCSRDDDTLKITPLNIEESMLSNIIEPASNLVEVPEIVDKTLDNNSVNRRDGETCTKGNSPQICDQKDSELLSSDSDQITSSTNLGFQDLDLQTKKPSDNRCDSTDISEVKQVDPSEQSQAALPVFLSETKEIHSKNKEDNVTTDAKRLCLETASINKFQEEDKYEKGGSSILNADESTSSSDTIVPKIADSERNTDLIQKIEDGQTERNVTKNISSNAEKELIEETSREEQELPHSTNLSDKVKFNVEQLSSSTKQLGNEAEVSQVVETISINEEASEKVVSCSSDEVPKNALQKISFEYIDNSSPDSTEVSNVNKELEEEIPSSVTEESGAHQQSLSVKTTDRTNDKLTIEEDSIIIQDSALINNQENESLTVELSRNVVTISDDLPVHPHRSDVVKDNLRCSNSKEIPEKEPSEISTEQLKEDTKSISSKDTPLPFEEENLPKVTIICEQQKTEQRNVEENFPQRSKEIHLKQQNEPAKGSFQKLTVEEADTKRREDPLVLCQECPKEEENIKQLEQKTQTISLKDLKAALIDEEPLREEEKLDFLEENTRLMSLQDPEENIEQLEAGTQNISLHDDDEEKCENLEYAENINTENKEQIKISKDSLEEETISKKEDIQEDLLSGKLSSETSKETLEEQPKKFSDEDSLVERKEQIHEQTSYEKSQELCLKETVLCDVESVQQNTNSVKHNKEDIMISNRLITSKDHEHLDQQLGCDTDKIVIEENPKVHITPEGKETALMSDKMAKEQSSSKVIGKSLNSDIISNVEMPFFRALPKDESSDKLKTGSGKNIEEFPEISEKKTNPESQKNIPEENENFEPLEKETLRISLDATEAEEATRKNDECSQERPDAYIEDVSQDSYLNDIESDTTLVSENLKGEENDPQSNLDDQENEQNSNKTPISENKIIRTQETMYLEQMNNPSTSNEVKEQVFFNQSRTSNKTDEPSICQENYGDVEEIKLGGEKIITVGVQEKTEESEKGEFVFEKQISEVIEHLPRSPECSSESRQRTTPFSPEEAPENSVDTQKIQHPDEEGILMDPDQDDTTSDDIKNLVEKQHICQEDNGEVEKGNRGSDKPESPKALRVDEEMKEENNLEPVEKCLEIEEETFLSISNNEHIQTQVEKETLTDSDKEDMEYDSEREKAIEESDEVESLKQLLDDEDVVSGSNKEAFKVTEDQLDSFGSNDIHQETTISFSLGEISEIVDDSKEISIERVEENISREDLENRTEEESLSEKDEGIIEQLEHVDQQFTLEDENIEESIAESDNTLSSIVIEVKKSDEKENFEPNNDLIEPLEVTENTEKENTEVIVEKRGSSNENFNQEMLMEGSVENTIDDGSKEQTISQENEEGLDQLEDVDTSCCLSLDEDVPRKAESVTPPSQEDNVTISMEKESSTEVPKNESPQDQGEEDTIYNDTTNKAEEQSVCEKNVEKVNVPFSSEPTTGRENVENQDEKESLGCSTEDKEEKLDSKQNVLRIDELKHGKPEAEVHKEDEKTEDGVEKQIFETVKDLPLSLSQEEVPENAVALIEDDSTNDKHIGNQDEKETPPDTREFSGEANDAKTLVESIITISTEEQSDKVTVNDEKIENEGEKILIERDATTATEEEREKETSIDSIELPTKDKETKALIETVQVEESVNNTTNDENVRTQVEKEISTESREVIEDNKAQVSIENVLITLLEEEGGKSMINNENIQNEDEKETEEGLIVEVNEAKTYNKNAAGVSVAEVSNSTINSENEGETKTPMDSTEFIGEGNRAKSSIENIPEVIDDSYEESAIFQLDKEEKEMSTNNISRSENIEDSEEIVEVCAETEKVKELEKREDSTVDLFSDFSSEECEENYTEKEEQNANPRGDPKITSELSDDNVVEPTSLEDDEKADKQLEGISDEIEIDELQKSPENVPEKQDITSEDDKSISKDPLVSSSGSFNSGEFDSKPFKEDVNKIQEEELLRSPKPQINETSESAENVDSSQDPSNIIQIKSNTLESSPTSPNLIEDMTSDKDEPSEINSSIYDEDNQSTRINDERLLDDKRDSEVGENVSSNDPILTSSIDLENTQSDPTNENVPKSLHVDDEKSDDEENLNVSISHSEEVAQENCKIISVLSFHSGESKDSTTEEIVKEDLSPNQLNADIEEESISNAQEENSTTKEGREKAVEETRKDNRETSLDELDSESSTTGGVIEDLDTIEAATKLNLAPENSDVKEQEMKPVLNFLYQEENPDIASSNPNDLQPIERKKVESEEMQENIESSNLSKDVSSDYPEDIVDNLNNLNLNEVNVDIKEKELSSNEIKPTTDFLIPEETLNVVSSNSNDLRPVDVGESAELEEKIDTEITGENIKNNYPEKVDDESCGTTEPSSSVNLDMESKELKLGSNFLNEEENPEEIGDENCLEDSKVPTESVGEEHINLPNKKDLIPVETIAQSTSNQSNLDAKDLPAKETSFEEESLNVILSDHGNKEKCKTLDDSTLTKEDLSSIDKELPTSEIKTFSSVGEENLNITSSDDPEEIADKNCDDVEILSSSSHSNSNEAKDPTTDTIAKVNLMAKLDVLEEKVVSSAAIDVEIVSENIPHSSVTEADLNVSKRTETIKNDHPSNTDTLRSKLEASAESTLSDSLKNIDDVSKVMPLSKGNDQEICSEDTKDAANSEGVLLSEGNSQSNVIESKSEIRLEKIDGNESKVVDDIKDVSSSKENISTPEICNQQNLDKESIVQKKGASNNEIITGKSKEHSVLKGSITSESSESQQVFDEISETDNKEILIIDKTKTVLPSEKNTVIIQASEENIPLVQIPEEYIFVPKNSKNQDRLEEKLDLQDKEISNKEKEVTKKSKEILASQENILICKVPDKQNLLKKANVIDKPTDVLVSKQTSSDKNIPLVEISEEQDLSKESRVQNKNVSTNKSTEENIFISENSKKQEILVKISSVDSKEKEIIDVSKNILSLEPKKEEILDETPGDEDKETGFKTSETVESKCTLRTRGKILKSKVFNVHNAEKESLMFTKGTNNPEKAKESEQSVPILQNSKKSPKLISRAIEAIGKRNDSLSTEANVSSESSTQILIGEKSEGRGRRRGRRGRRKKIELNNESKEGNVSKKLGRPRKNHNSKLEISSKEIHRDEVEVIDICEDLENAKENLSEVAGGEHDVVEITDIAEVESSKSDNAVRRSLRNKNKDDAKGTEEKDLSPEAKKSKPSKGKKVPLTEHKSKSSENKVVEDKIEKDQKSSRGNMRKRSRRIAKLNSKQSSDQVSCQKEVEKTNVEQPTPVINIDDDDEIVEITTPGKESSKNNLKGNSFEKSKLSNSQSAVAKSNSFEGLHEDSDSDSYNADQSFVSYSPIPDSASDRDDVAANIRDEDVSLKSAKASDDIKEIGNSNLPTKQLVVEITKLPNKIMPARGRGRGRGRWRGRGRGGFRGGRAAQQSTAPTALTVEGEKKKEDEVQSVENGESDVQEVVQIRRSTRRRPGETFVIVELPKARRSRGAKSSAGAKQSEKQVSDQPEVEAKRSKLADENQGAEEVKKRPDSPERQKLLDAGPTADGEEEAEDLKPKVFLTCVNIQKLQEPERIPSPVSIKSSIDGDNDNEIVAEVPVDENIDDTNNSDVILIEDDPPNESDDCVEVTSPSKTMTLSTFQLDVDDSPPLASSKRSLRKRGIQELDQDNEDTMLTKKRKIKGKRPVDHDLRRSIEEQKKQEMSSSEEEEESNKSHTKGTLMETKKKSHKGYKRKKTLLGLDIPSMVDLTETMTGNVRQSRRIAQMKIREEAERRKLEEMSLHDEQERKRKNKKNEDKDYKGDRSKKKSKFVEEDTAVIIPSDDDIDSKKKKKRKKHIDPRKIFDECNPWRSSSDSSSNEDQVEDEEEDIAEESDPGSPLFKSDHEFSPESDIEGGEEIQPLKRARTARKEDEDEIDDCACQKCGKKDHPEWILLCDGCDNGWHCSCLRPALLVIPEGDWYCPPCQHVMLIKNLEEKLVDLDKRLAKREIEVRRKERLAYVGISLANVLPVKEVERKKKERTERDDADPDNEEESSSESESSESDSETPSDTDSDEPIYQLRQRRQAHSYRFNDYDELINSAIQDEMDAAKGAGNQGRGKDIATIVSANEQVEEPPAQEPQKEEPKDPSLVVALTAAESTELPVAVVPPSHETEEEEEEFVKPAKKLIGRKKPRKLNCLDVSSGDDAYSDEDFKGSSSEEDEEDYEEEMGSDSSDYGGRRKGPIRRSTRARTSRYDKDFINDDTEEEEDDEDRKRKKGNRPWSESESEESDQSWGRRKRSRRNNIASPRKRKPKKSKKRSEDSDEDHVNKKKRRIKYGGLNDEDDDEAEEVGRRTRGKKINFAAVLASDSDDEVPKRAPQKLESDDDFVAEDAEQEEEDEEIEMEPTSNKVETKSTAIEGAASEPRVIIQMQQQLATVIAPLPEKDVPFDDSQEDDEELNPIEAMNKNLEEMDEEEMEKWMEEEEYATKQLQLMAMQLEKEKKRKEREALKKIQEEIPLKIPQKRGRKPKSLTNLPAEQTTSDSNPDLPLFGEISPIGDSPKKRRGRGKGKKTLEKEAAAAAAAAVGTPLPTKQVPLTIETPSTDIQNAKLAIAAPPQPFAQTQPVPSVITRMLQGGRPGDYGQMENYYAEQPAAGEAGPPPGSAAIPPVGIPTSGSLPPMPQPYLPGGPGSGSQQYRPPPPQLNPYHRSSPVPSQAQQHRMRQPTPGGMYHQHHPMDPSPSGGGAITVPPTGAASEEGDAPATAPAASESPHSNKSDQTPPPQPYPRPQQLAPRFGTPPGIPGSPVRHQVPPPQPQHIAHQSPRMGMPYQPPVQQNFFYMSSQNLGGEDNINYQYGEQQFADTNSPQEAAKGYEEENSGEFGGLVSYFSSQREDDLDT